MEPHPIMENDVDGILKCLLCDYARPCNSIEEIEFFSLRHALESHNMRICSRLEFADDGQSARLVNVPEIGE